MTRNTEDKKLQDNFTIWVMEIQPKIQSLCGPAERNWIDSPLTDTLDKQKIFYLSGSVKKSIELFRKQKYIDHLKLSAGSSNFGAILGENDGKSDDDQEYYTGSGK
jgi:oligoendopeptidase F